MGGKKHFGIYDLDHSAKYKVFNLCNSDDEVVCRISGMGHELPHNRLRYMLVGQKYRIKKLKYERIL